MAVGSEHPRVIRDVIVHLENDLPVMVDVDELPSGNDRILRCTNVRTVDGKRPSFVHDRTSTFVFPLDVIRMIEAPVTSTAVALPAPSDGRLPIDDVDPPPLEPEGDEEPDQRLLERIRQI